MKKDNRVFLTDMLESIEAIQDYMDNKQEADLANDNMLRDAVVRRLEILGEAANRLSSDFIEAHADFPVRVIVSMRNLLIHEYDAVRIEKLWEAIQENLPGLKIQVEKLLE